MTSSNDEGDPQLPPPPPQLTPSALLRLCTLPPQSTRHERTTRLGTLEHWKSTCPDRLASLLRGDGDASEDGGASSSSSSSSDEKSGCFPLHWAAGTGFDEAVSFILEHGDDKRDDDGVGDGDGDGGTTPHSHHPLAEQRALHPSTGRRPLHYAARNGHLTTCELLLRRYGVHPNPSCDRGSVTPLQLAVWQNRLAVVRLLVEVNGGDVVMQKNDFRCGLMHWIGLVPKKRWGGTEDGDDGDNGGDGDDDGSGVLPLARYLHSLGVTYDSTAPNTNSQGHTPLLKAAWGGNLALLKYYRDEHAVYDDVQDVCGNYGADLAKMGGHRRVQRWLQEQCSTDRSESCGVLGLDVTSVTEAEIKRRYVELARVCHPDKSTRSGSVRGGSGDGSDADGGSDFLSIKAAYEHLMGGGGGNQRNPKFDDLKLLTDAERMNDGTERGGSAAGESISHDDRLFCARILALISDYGDNDKGFPISLIPRRWNQIWPDGPFPPPDEYVIQIDAICSATGASRTIFKRVKFVRFLRWKCGKAVIFRKVAGDTLAFKRTSK